MASTSQAHHAHPSIQRINNAYVQVPASPLSLATYRPLKTPIYAASSIKLKENTPLRPLQYATNTSASRKRKLSNCDSIHAGPISVLKKVKLVAADATPSKVRSQPIVPTANACPDFPNGYAYCHQCCRKRDILIILQCDVVKHRQTKRNGTVEWPCVNKYCQNCLKRRYNKELEGCANGVASFFTCPRCQGICNCPRCKKMLGSPLGSRSNVPGAPKTAKSEKLQVQNFARTKVEDIVKPPKKVLPQLKWTPVPYIITQAQAEERIFIREFVLRFGHIMEPVIAKSCLEELEFIAGKAKKNEDNGMVVWVSEPCLKGLVLGLLGLLAKDHETEIAKEVITAIKAIRSAGANLNKIWANLSVLRDNVPLTFPDPSPAPLSFVRGMRSLRNVGRVEAFVNVVHTAQMIPVLVSLIHSVLETANIREEIDQGIKDARDIARDAKEAIKIEKERWVKERQDMGDISQDGVNKNEDKAKGKAHKNRILDINNVLKLTTHGFTPRFSILGMDNEGRTYYALSPGVLEREVAFEYLEVVSADKPRTLKKKGRSLAAQDRSEMKEWSWFVGVWGKKPLPERSKNLQPTKTDSSDGDDEEQEAEKWWGFWEPEEIVKVADWIFIKSKLEDEEIQTKDPAKVQLRHLVAQLKDYAALLEWRTCENKFSITPMLP